MQSPVELLDQIEAALNNPQDFELFLLIMIRSLGDPDKLTDQMITDAMFDFCARFLEGEH